MMRPLIGLSRKDNAKLIGEFIDAVAPTHFVTLATNWDSSLFRSARLHRSLPPHQKLLKIADALESWGAQTDRALLGRSWHKKRALRIRGFGVPEHVETNIHYHCFIRVDASICSTMFEASAKSIWKSLVPTGDANVESFLACHTEIYVSKEGRTIDFGNFGIIGPK